MDSKKPKKSKTKSSIPTSTSTKSKSSSSKFTKEPKKKEDPTKSTKKSKVKVEKAKSPSPEPVNEYEDDFESYEDDFEDEVSEIKTVRKESPKAAVIVPSPELKRETRIEELVESEVEEEEDTRESILLNRVNQAKFMGPIPANRTATTTLSRNYDTRPTTSANRVFTFENKSIPNTETLMLSANVFAKLKSDGRLTRNFIQSVDIAPNRMSELYNNLIENSTSSQRYTQTGEDGLENHSQTTPREFNDKANQFPAIFVKSENPSESRSQKDTGNFATAERFLKFVGISGRTFLSLLSSDKSAESVHLPLRSNVEFSNGCVQFSLDELSKKSKPMAIELSCGNEPKILVGFYLQDSDKHQLVDKSILLEYSFDNLEQPINVYLTSDEITDFSYSSDGKSLVFAGQRSGNCLLWDLLNRNLKSESENIPQIELGNKSTPQFPAYSTSYILAERKKRAFVHQSDQSILQTKALHSRESNQQQFLSLNSGAVVTIWAATRDQFTTNDDLGLDFSSLVRLMKISSSVCATILGFGSGAQVALSLDSQHSNEFIVGMSQGGVIRVCRSRHEEKRLRRFNLTSGVDQLSANSVCFSPHDHDYFAAGTSNGSLLLFKTSNQTPLMELQLKESRPLRVNQLTNIVWSHSHAQIIYALYDSKYFAIWDLSSSPNIEPEIVDLGQKFGSSIIRMFSWRLINSTAYIGFTLTSGSCLIHELHRSSVPNTSLGRILSID